MPTYYVKLRDTEQPIQVEADEDPENGELNPYVSSTIVFKRGGRAIGRFQISQVIGWWSSEDEDNDAVVI